MEAAEEQELSEIVVAHDEIKGFAFGEIETCGFGEIKSTHRRSDFTRTK